MVGEIRTGWSRVQGVSPRGQLTSSFFQLEPSYGPHLDMALSALATQAARPHPAVCFFAGSQEVGVCAGPALALEPRRRSVTDSTATATPIKSSTTTNHR